MVMSECWQSMTSLVLVYQVNDELCSQFFLILWVALWLELLSMWRVAKELEE